MQLQNFYHKDGHPTIRKDAGRERPATGKSALGPYSTTKPPEAPVFQLPSSQGAVGATADG